MCGEFINALLTNYFSMNKITGWVVAIIAIGIIIFLVAPRIMPKTSSPSGTATTSKLSGTVFISFTDATTDIQNISEISMSVKKVELYSSTQGWVTVANDSKKYELLDLHAKGQTKIYASIKVPEGTYTRSRVSIDNVVVRTKSGAEKTATVPSKTWDLDSRVVVKANKDSSVRYDVLADKSIHATAKSEYIFAPVVVVETRSDASVSTASADGVITINGGSVDSSTTVGMDIDGSIKSNFQLNLSSKLELNSSGTIINSIGGSVNGIIK